MNEGYQAPADQHVEQSAETVETLTEGYQVDQGAVEEILTILRDIHAVIDDVQVASNAIITYAVFYVPLAVIVFLLFRFFHTFIKDYR